MGGAIEWTWSDALTVFFVGFGGVFVGLVILMLSIIVYSAIARSIVKAFEKPKEENA